jgi:hypothetical protein
MASKRKPTHEEAGLHNTYVKKGRRARQKVEAGPRQLQIAKGLFQYDNWPELFKKKAEAAVKAGLGIQVPKEFGGGEILDPKPIEATLQLDKPESIGEKIDRLTRETANALLAEQGVETLDEMNDFDLPDEPMSVLTEYEMRGAVIDLQEDPGPPQPAPTEEPQPAPEPAPEEQPKA